ncbi:MAG: hypothetical protein GY938_07650 [Ketobacter sp.]|nr:hypothetical protein [Ketobacter sp.]
MIEAKWHITLDAWNYLVESTTDRFPDLPKATIESIENLYEEYGLHESPDGRYSVKDCVDELVAETRGEGEETGLSAEEDRHYESVAVGGCFDGVWVGWTYFYGGGKHGEPESMGWLEDAYYIQMETKMVEAKVFERLAEEVE